MGTAIPVTMQAVQIEHSGGPLRVQRIPVPRPGPGEVLVKIAASPINPSDLSLLEGSCVARKPLPFVPGIEASGTVVGAGSGLIPMLWMGRRVACAAGQTGDGAWAEYMATSAMHCFPLQKGISLQQGATLVVNPMTALAFFAIAKRERHPAVVSNAAASSLGRMIVRLGRENGLPIINIVRREEHVDLLRSLGAEHVLNSGDAGFNSRLKSVADSLGATLILDPVGGEYTQVLLENAPFGSTVLVYANLTGRQALFDPKTLVGENKRIAGFYLANWIRNQSLLHTLRDLWQAQRMANSALKTTIRKRFPMAAVQEAIDLYRSNMTAGKVLLVADSEAVACDD